MKTFIISDTHFGHNNIILFCDRPFKDTAEMTKQLIENWNSVVSKDDIVYHLGDVSMKTSKQDVKSIIEQLNGYKILIRGNHDNYDYSKLGFDEYHNYSIFLNGSIILSHYPILGLNNFLNIHGHIHDKDMKSDNHFNASVEKINYTPIQLEEIIKLKNWTTTDFKDKYLLDFRDYDTKN